MSLQVSLVIPARDEARSLPTLLASVRAQTRPPDEVVVVDGGSRDGSVELVEAWQRDWDRLRLVRTSGATPGEGRNLGIQAAAHQVIALTDAGIRLDPRWLEKLCEPMERDPGVEVVYGHYEPVADSFFTQCAALAYVPAPVEVAGARIRGPSVVSALLRRRVWEAVGGFPPLRAAEDLIFMEAIERAGFRIAAAPQAVAYWQMAPDWRSTFGRFSLYSYHNLAAGRARAWHYGVARLYLAALAVCGLAAASSRWWLLALPLGLLARALRTAYRKRAAFAFGEVLGVRRVACLMALQVWLDAATAWGFARWMARRLAARRPGSPVGKRVSGTSGA